MKLATFLLVFVSLSLAACRTTTLANRRDVYAPARGTGPYNEALDEGTWKDGVKVKKTPAKDAKPGVPEPATAPAPAA